MKQKERILKVLWNNCWYEVSARDLVIKTKVLHYTQIIKLLRDDWYIITNRTLWIKKNGEYIKHSFYKLEWETNNSFFWKLKRLFNI